MPPQAIKAIAFSGFFFALSMAAIAYYAWRMGFHPALIAFNLATTFFVIGGSFWMLAQAKKASANVLK